MVDSLTQLHALADPSEFSGPIEIGDLSPSQLKEDLRMMLLIRQTEEKIGEMVANSVVKCPCHLVIGQEAPAVAVSRFIKSGDRVFGAHRSHAHFLALGGSLDELMAEVQGKLTGCSKGMGGSMHLIDTSRGLYGTVPIVAATIPIAAGAALAAKMQKSDSVAVSFFGDGATEEGVFHESLNLASVFKLPVIFVCENNLFSSHLHINLRQPANSVSRYARMHMISAETVDGNDLGALLHAVERAILSARSGLGPRFIEAVTYRWRGHVGPREDLDVGVKRKDDLPKWKGRDPIRRLAQALTAAGHLDEKEFDRMRETSAKRVEAAWRKACEAPFPPETALLDCVYSR